MFRTRLLWALGVMAFLAATQGLLAVWASRTADFEVERGRLASDILKSFVELSANKQRLKVWYARHVLEVDFPAAPRDELIDAMRASLQQLRALSSRLDLLTQSRGDTEPRSAERVRTFALLETNIAELAAALAGEPAAGRDVPRAALIARFRMFDESQGEDLRRRLNLQIQEERVETQRARDLADQALARMRWIIGGVTLTSALLALALAAHLQGRVRRPLGVLQSGAKALREGDLAHRIPATGNDEFAELARSFNMLAEELQAHRQRETAARTELEQAVAARTAELEQAHITLQRLDERRRRLFADISHELRTPATAIRGEAEITLRGGDRPVEEYREALGRIVGISQQLARLIEDLMLIARSDVEQLTLRPERLDLQQVLADACLQARTLAQADNIRVDFDPAATSIHVLGDPQRLHQLFMTLLDNAVRYSRPHGQISVSVGVCAGVSIEGGGDGVGRARVLIDDEGIGVPPQELAHVFERHFRGDAARHHRSDGAGLGLAIAQLIAQAHHGDVSLEPRSGSGTRAVVILPCQCAASLDAAGST